MDDSKVHILVVDDDPGLRSLLQRYLIEQGMTVTTVQDSKEMDEFFIQNSAHLIILDLMLPGEDGLSIARRIKATLDLPIIILSAKGDDVEKIIGLEMGADDYLAKPFNPRELLARIKAVLRRHCPKNKEKKSPFEDISHDTIQFADFKLDLTNRSFFKKEDEIILTNGEFKLLEILCKHPEHALSRDHLMDLIGGFDRTPFDRSIDIKITRLRKKIESDPKNPQFIRTIWGIGYMFTPDGNSH